MRQLFQLVFRKAEGSPYTPSNAERKAILLFKGGDDMQNLFDHIGKVTDSDSFDQAIAKIENALKGRTNSIVQRIMLFDKIFKRIKKFDKWSIEVSNAAHLIDYSNHNWKMAVVDAIILQTSNNKLLEKALDSDVSHDKIMSLGVSEEQSEKGPAMLSGSRKIKEEDVNKLQSGKKQSKSPKCQRCGYDSCQGAKKCLANNKSCAKCKRDPTILHNFVCKAKDINQVPDYESEEDTIGRILEVKKLTNKGIAAEVRIKAYKSKDGIDEEVNLSTETGVRKTLLNKVDWNKVKASATLLKTSKLFRPYGTTYHSPIIGRA